MWQGYIPWAGRHWALPVLTVLAPSSRYHQQQGRRHLCLASEGFSLSSVSTDMPELPAILYHRMVDSLAYAA
ncbi:MAG: hypothetical protein J4G13_08710 [Dehalococcoidia bacterium]|nr:hypothetical protein [Dehalococcoidia bacterium]